VSSPVNCGDTFLTGDEDDDYHLWIVITPPFEDEVVTVSVTTRRKRSETLVVLQAGDHPFLRHESVIPYAFARVRNISDIAAAIANDTARKRETASNALLKRAQAGLLESDFTPNGVKSFFKEVMNNEANH
jgi:mRNA-degrading endonuclease toxin of MazEF toxin-antitoxin module